MDLQRDWGLEKEVLWRIVNDSPAGIRLAVVKGTG